MQMAAVVFALALKIQLILDYCQTACVLTASTALHPNLMTASLVSQRDARIVVALAPVASARLPHLRAQARFVSVRADITMMVSVHNVRVISDKYKFD
jgi:hypothetical protein